MIYNLYSRYVSTFKQYNTIHIRFFLKLKDQIISKVQTFLLKTMILHFVIPVKISFRMNHLNAFIQCYYNLRGNFNRQITKLALNESIDTEFRIHP